MAILAIISSPPHILLFCVGLQEATNKNNISEVVDLMIRKFLFLNCIIVEIILMRNKYLFLAEHNHPRALLKINLPL
jgi:hypothetical protein